MQMATLPKAQELLEELRSASFEAAKADLSDVQQFAADASETEPLVQWDVSFWAERLRCSSRSLALLTLQVSTHMNIHSALVCSHVECISTLQLSSKCA